MNRKLKALGLALVAVFALTAISASSASAALFTAGSTTGTVTATQVGTHVFTVSAGQVKCTEASATGTYLSASTEEQTVTPTYKNCTAFGFVETEIDTAGCTYTLKAAAPTAETGTVKIFCTGNPITVTAFNCEVTVPNQTLTGITYHNSGAAVAPMDLIQTINISGITYIQHEKKFPGCNTKGTENVATSLFHNGTFSGETTVIVRNTAGTQVDLTVS